MARKQPEHLVNVQPHFVPGTSWVSRYNLWLHPEDARIYGERFKDPSQVLPGLWASPDKICAGEQPVLIARPGAVVHVVDRVVYDRGWQNWGTLPVVTIGDDPTRYVVHSTTPGGFLVPA